MPPTDGSADAVDVLTDLLQWSLPAAGWPRVTELVDVLTTALRAGDAAGVRAATFALELASPPRITRVGAGEPVPPVVRERVNVLIHELSSPPAGGPGQGGPGQRRSGRGGSDAR